MVMISVDGDAVPIMFPVDDDGYVDVSACRLALRFHMTRESIYMTRTFTILNRVSCPTPLDRLRLPVVLEGLGDFYWGSLLHTD